MLKSFVRDFPSFIPDLLTFRRERFKLKLYIPFSLWLFVSIYSVSPFEYLWPLLFCTLLLLLFDHRLSTDIASIPYDSRFHPERTLCQSSFRRHFKFFQMTFELLTFLLVERISDKYTAVSVVMIYTILSIAFSVSMSLLARLNRWSIASLVSILKYPIITASFIGAPHFNIIDSFTAVLYYDYFDDEKIRKSYPATVILRLLLFITIASSFYIFRSDPVVAGVIAFLGVVFSDPFRLINRNFKKYSLFLFTIIKWGAIKWAI